MSLQNLRYLPNLIQKRLHSLPLVVLYLTDGCNSRCAMCNIWQAPRRNMDMDLVSDIVEDCKALGTRSVLLSGGEAMQHPEWPRIAAMFRAAGMQVWLLTNGLFLKKQATEVIATIDAVTLSLDAATPELYQQIRGVDALNLILEGMQTISQKVRVSTRSTLMKINYVQMPLIIDTALHYGATSVSFLAVDTVNPYAFGTRFEDEDLLPMAKQTFTDPFGGLAADDLPRFAAILNQLEAEYAAYFTDGRIEESLAKLRRLYDYFASAHGLAEFEPPRCNAPHISAVIGVDGRLQPCYFLPPVGENGLKDLNNEAAQTMRVAYSKGQRAECTRCVCPLYRGPRSLLRGI